MNFLSIYSVNRKWYQVILWWEFRRIAYNLALFIAGQISFYIAFVTIPLVYIIIGLALNLIYTFGWIIELLIIKKLSSEPVILKYPKYSFIVYLIISIFFVFGFAITLVIR